MDGSMAGGNGGSQEAVRGMRDSGSEVGKASLADTVAEAVAQSENSIRAATVSTSLAAVVTLEDDLRYFPETLVSLLRHSLHTAARCIFPILLPAAAVILWFRRTAVR